MSANKTRFLLVTLLALVGTIAMMGQRPVSAALVPAPDAGASVASLSASLQVTATATLTATKTVTPTVAAATATKTVTPTVAAATATKTLTPTVAAATATKTVTPTVAAATATKTLTPTVAAATATKTATRAPATVTKTATPAPTRTATTAARLGPRAGTVASLSTGFRVQNLDQATTASVTAQFINGTGTVVNSVSSAVGPGLSTVIDQRATTGGGLDCGALCTAPWNGSVVLSSNTQIASVVQEFSASAAVVGQDFRSDAYNGITSAGAATTVYLPQVLEKVYDNSRNKWYNSMIAIQNADLNASANVTITFFVPGGSSYVKPSFSIPASSSQFVDMGVDTTIPGSAIPFGFNGSATITSDKPVAVVVNQNAAGTLMVYTGFTSSDAGTQLSVPSLLKNVYDSRQGYTWGAALFVMALDSSTPTDIYVSYKNSAYSPAHTINQHITMQPSVLIDLTSNPDFAGETYMYASAVVTSTKQIIAMVTQQTNTDLSRGSRALSFRGFPNAAGSATVFVPTLLRSVTDTSSGVTWSTGLTLQWQGTLSTTVTLTYTNAANGNANIVKTVNLGPNVPMMVIDQSVDSQLTGANSIFYGSAVLTSNNGQPFVAIVNQLGDINAPGDSAMSFRGVNQ